MKFPIDIKLKAFSNRTTNSPFASSAFLIMDKSVLVDYGKKDAALKIFPSKPLLSSNKATFGNLQVQHYALPGHEAPEHLSTHDVIVVFHESMSLIKRGLGGVFKEESVRAGDIVISPGKTSHSACWNEDALFTLMLIKPGCIAHSEPELTNPDRIELLPHFATPDPLISGIGETFRSLLASQQPIDSTYIDSITICLTAHLRQKYCSIKHKLIENIHALSDIELQQISEYVRSNLDQKFTTTDLARLLALSSGYFSRRFAKSTGFSVHEYVIECRLEQVKHLLASTHLDLSGIAKQTGFSSPYHLSNMFQKRFSLTPCRYRKML